jgi:hypothetical protein
MPYSLITDVDHEECLYARMNNGEICHTQDFSDAWDQLDLNAGGIHRQMIGY